MIVKSKGINDLEGFLIGVPASMRYALNHIRYAKGNNEALIDALDIILQVERETDAGKINALLTEEAVKIARLRELLEDVGYARSEAWAVVEEMQRFAKAEAERK